jgi:hypothetical protein
MGGLYGVASKEDCVADLFYGTDCHSHLGTRRGGLAVKEGRTFTRFIKDITNAQFRSKFQDDTTLHILLGRRRAVRGMFGVAKLKLGKLMGERLWTTVGSSPVWT